MSLTPAQSSSKILLNLKMQRKFNRKKNITVNGENGKQKHIYLLTGVIAFSYTARVAHRFSLMA